MRSMLTVFPVGLLLSYSMAQAGIADQRAWLEMAAVCTRVISEQSTSAMDGLTAAAPLVNIARLAERAVRHPGGAVKASAVSDGTSWFMCLVAGDPRIRAAEHRALAGVIWGHWRSRSPAGAITAW